MYKPRTENREPKCNNHWLNSTSDPATMMLELASFRPYFRNMKRLGFLLLTLTLCAGPDSRGQDAATEERLNQLSGKIETLLEGQDAIRKRLNELTREIENVREQASKPTGNFASQEDLKRLAESV